MSSTTTGLANLNGKIIGDTQLPIPPTPEQIALANFLNALDKRINRLLRHKYRLIGLLNEQKQAIILRAVTQGLDASVPMKPSGVDWLQDMPAHWNVQRNGSLFSERNERGDAAWPILVVSLRNGVTTGGEQTAEGRPGRLIEDRTTYKKALKGDITYNTMRMWQGAIGVSPIDGLVSPAYVVAAPRPHADAQFFTYLYRTAVYKSEINRVSTGIVSDRNRLYWDQFKNLPAPVPPIAEQRHIVAILQQEEARIDSTTVRTLKEIELIREYRTRLVADVVTGKLDVRDAVLPDDVPGLDEAAEDSIDALADEDENLADDADDGETGGE